MPGGDRTGPMGAGPRTGRAAGYCGGFGMPGYMNPIGGRGLGLGFGRGFRGGGFGRGLGRGFWGAYGWGAAVPWPQTDAAGRAQILKDQVRVLEQQAEALRAQLAALESETKED